MFLKTGNLYPNQDHLKLNFRNKVTTIPSEVHVGDAFAIKVVAWVHADGSWAAYCGPSDWSDEQVARQGDILRRNDACGLFYVLAVSGRPYREL